MTFHIRKKTSHRRRLVIVFLTVWMVLLSSVGAYFYYLYSEIHQRFASRKWSVPSRVFSAAVPLFPGQSLGLPQLKQMLEERRYKEAQREPLRAGEYRVQKNTLHAYFRDFAFPGRHFASQRIQFDFSSSGLSKIRTADGDLAFCELEPLEIARLFGSQRESRLLINIHQVSPYLVNGIIAIEDHRFYEHAGVDWLSILRAIWTDVRAGRFVQGGSTITQQLVKNYFLEPQRNLKRKLLEASMAIVIEALYSKDEILEMYMNEIYLGQRGSVAIHGMGEAARYLFGRNVEDLTLAEGAALAGIIQAPNTFSPLAHPEACRDRRNMVLKRMLDLGKINAQEYEKALSEPIQVPEYSLPANVAPYFVDYVRQQLQELYVPRVLESEGLNIYTTLQPEIAFAADTAIREGVRELEKEMPRSDLDVSSEPLQAVLIALQPKTGNVLALIGGRNYDEGRFNRALHAHRQPGSAIKPFVYLEALERFYPVSWIADEPTTYMVHGLSWTPRNFDDKYRGNVMLREALEQSLNVPTVNLALAVGLEKLIAILKDLGIQSPLEAVPSLALGEFELTPIELAGAAATLDNDGQKPFLLSLKEVVSETGEVQERRDVDLVSVTSPVLAYMITDMLQGAMEKGPGKAVKRMGVDFPCAGLVGTTVESQDSWFIGYTTDLVTLVWVGFDDSRPTRLNGAQGAGRIWARFISKIRPWLHPQSFHMPPGVVQRIVCVKTGQMAGIACPDKRLEVFSAETVPKEYCRQHVRE